jgi:P-type Ca2+ transporter type 2C
VTSSPRTAGCSPRRPFEAQEAALTGESAPVGKDPAPVDHPDTPLNDRSSMLYQNTSVTRGSGRMVVTATGMATEVGRIASMLGAVTRTRSPLQRQLDGLSRTLGLIACWGALAVILVVGLIRGLSFSELMLLGIAMAVSAIPTNLPTFVQSMLASGAQQRPRRERSCATSSTWRPWAPPARSTPTRPAR